MLILTKILITEYSFAGECIETTEFHIPYNKNNNVDFTVTDYREQIALLENTIQTISSLIARIGEKN